MRQGPDKDGSVKKSVWDDRPSCLGCLGVILLLPIMLLGYWTISERNLARERIPENVVVERQLYNVTKSFGMGLPGDAETGVVLFELEAANSERLQELLEKAATPDAIGEIIGNSRRFQYRGWQRTPFDAELAGAPWSKRQTIGQSVSLARLLAREEPEGAYSIEIDEGVKRRIDDIAGSPGAIYATGRGSTIIVVAPRERLLIFGFAG